MTDRYTKTVLTVIAAALVWLAVDLPAAGAAGAQDVKVTAISYTAADNLARRIAREITNACRCR